TTTTTTIDEQQRSLRTQGLEWLQRAASGPEGYLPAKLFLSLLLYRGENEDITSDPVRARSLLDEILSTTIADTDLSAASSVVLARHYLAAWSSTISSTRDTYIEVHLAFLTRPTNLAMLYNLGVVHEKEERTLLAIKAYKTCVQRCRNDNDKLEQREIEI